MELECFERTCNSSFRFITSYLACKQKRTVGEIRNAFDCREQSVKSSYLVLRFPGTAFSTNLFLLLPGFGPLTDNSSQ